MKGCSPQSVLLIIGTLAFSHTAQAETIRHSECRAHGYPQIQDEQQQAIAIERVREILTEEDWNCTSEVELESLVCTHSNLDDIDSIDAVFLKDVCRQPAADMRAAFFYLYEAQPVDVNLDILRRGTPSRTFAKFFVVGA